MKAKRLDQRAIWVVTALLIGVPATADAQYDGRQWRLPSATGAGAAGSATRGVQPKPQPQVVFVPNAPSMHYRTVFPRQTTFVLVPAVVLPDGRVFANFGYGYEQVFRSCSGAVVVGQPSVIAGNGMVLSPAAPPTYTQPVPNQQTASQQMAAGIRQADMIVTSAAYSSCFSWDGAGRVFVYRF